MRIAPSDGLRFFQGCNGRQSTFRERQRDFVNGGSGSERRWLLRLLLVVAAGLLLGRLGPFGTFADLSAGARYAYWIGLTLLMWLQGLAVLALLDRPLAQRGWPQWGRLVVSAIAAAVPTGFEVAWAEMLLRVERDLGPVDLLAIIVDVALLSVPLLFLTHGLDRPSPAIQSDPDIEATGTDALVALMDPGKRGALLAIGSEDHYVRLYSDRGESLVAMRFSNALATLTSQDGIQVHRSWWVADGAVHDVNRAGEGLQLTLRNGLKVPVSRSYAVQVRGRWADRLD